MIMSGVTYYKLYNDIYPGDVTKGCGLTGPEIDGNFYFLRGMDITSAEVDVDLDEIVLTRLNSEKIIISGLSEYVKSIVGSDISFDGSYYDSETGSLHLIVNSGETVIEKFFTLNDIHVDCTIIGDGSEENPFGVSSDILSGVSEEIAEAIAAEAEIRKTAVAELADNILAEALRAKKEESDIRSSVETVSDRLSAEVSARKADIARVEKEISEAVKDTAINKDIVISESSPLYPFISGIWENNTIPSGTTLTEFVEKLCSADTRMVYYVNTSEADIDNVISAFGDYAKPAENLGSVSFNASGNTGAHIIGFALPKPHTLSAVTASGSGFEQNITDKFFNNPIREFKYNGNVYSLYYYKILLTVGLRSNENYNVTFA